jgi:hypothetical protein
MLPLRLGAKQSLCMSAVADFSTTEDLSFKVPASKFPGMLWEISTMRFPRDSLISIGTMSPPPLKFVPDDHHVGTAQRTAPGFNLPDEAILATSISRVRLALTQVF